MADTTPPPPAPPPPPPPAPPQNYRKPLLLNRYEVGKLLGQGNFAKVYAARNIHTNDTVAIKILDKSKVLKIGLAGHVKREISILRRLRHPNIVQLFELMASKSKIYLIMELVRGGELFNKLSKGRLREQSARNYFQQLISAVAFCHARGVYHRDLKPENLLLDSNNGLKVSDFGLGAVSEVGRKDGLFHTFCGTPAYVAPEVLLQKGYDAAKVDVWSCGVILFVLMAGYLPFHDSNVMILYRKICKGDFRCPRWFSPDLIRFLNRLLDVNPSSRITIPEIMENRWFKKGFRDVRFYFENDRFFSLDDSDKPLNEKSELEFECSVSPKGRGLGLPRRASLNAFDIISFSAGFDLSGLFEEAGEETRFVSGESVGKIVSKLEEIAKILSFSVRKKDWLVNLEGNGEGEKGPLKVAAEIFELTPSLVVVEVKKKAGDRGEYEEFCKNQLKPYFMNDLYDQSVVGSDTE